MRALRGPLPRSRPVQGGQRHAGHAAGDRLLRLAGRRLKKCVRASDIVARLGGDEFAVIQFGIGEDNAGGELAARIVRSLSAPYRVGAHYANVGASVGIALAPRDGCDVQALIKNADIALYEAKAGGRRIYRRFDRASRPACRNAARSKSTCAARSRAGNSSSSSSRSSRCRPASRKDSRRSSVGNVRTAARSSRRCSSRSRKRSASSSRSANGSCAKRAGRSPAFPAHLSWP